MILFGSETGTSERFAKLALKELRYLNPSFATLNEYSSVEAMLSLSRFTHILIITSTFGAGGPPFNASKFNVEGIPSLQRIQYSVLALGNTSYPAYCAYGIKVL